MVGKSRLKKWSVISLVFVTILTFFLAFQIPNLGFDYNFEKFFPSKDTEASYFYQHREKFESDNDFLLIAIENKNGVFQLDFLKDVQRFGNELKTLPYVKGIQSIVEMPEVFIFPGGATSTQPYLLLTEKNDSSSIRKIDLKRDSSRIYSHQELIASLLAPDGNSLCVFLRHEDYLSKKKSDELIEKVQQTVEKYDFEKVRIAGRTIGQKYYIDKMTYEMVFYVSLSLVLVVLFLWIAFKSLWGIVIPQIVIILTMLWVVGLMAFLEEPINIILTILPSILFVVGMSDVIHIVSRYLDAIREGNSKLESVKIALREVGFATLLTSLTTSIGFFTLLFVQVQPIQAFGIVVGIGVLVAFVLTILVLPALFLTFPSPKKILVSKEMPFWTQFLRKSFLLVLRKRKSVLWIFGIFTLAMIYGTTKIEVNNYLMDDLRPSESIKQDFNFLDANYGGIRPLEIAIELKDTSRSFWDKEVLSDLEKIENYLQKEYKAKVNISLAQTLKVLNRSSFSGNPDSFELPESKSKIRRFRQLLRTAQQGVWLASMLDSSETTTRINGNIPDWGNQKIQEKNKQFALFLKQEIDNSVLAINITGTAHLIDKNMNYLSGSLVKGILVSIALITVLMGFLFRSVSMIFISLVPNLIPLLVLSGIMGFFGIELKISTAIIFTIAFGIAVDDTIHLLGKFKFELNKGRSKLYALKRAYLTTGKAMILTTLILCSGFMMLVFSSFMGTFIMGLMITVTLLFALILDLTLLPVLVFLFFRKGKKER
jgi:uncharacterized protein